MRLISSFCLILLVCGFAVFGQTNSQEKSEIKELLQKHAYAFEMKNGKLSGAGEKFLTDAMKDVQFVAYGEVHNRRAVHQFGEALFRLLQKKFDFQYLALEEDEYLGKMLSQAARRGGAEEVFKIGLKYPNAFHLFTEDELQMIGTIGRISKAKKNPVWGLNQVYGASHIYARLVEIAPDKKARETAAKLLKESLAYEKERFQKNVHFVAEIAKPEDFKLLRKIFKPSPNSEAAELIDQIELSNQIYMPYFQNPEPPSEIFYKSGETRETNMKHLFAERYREALADGASLPKVLAMFGHTHLFRGLSDRTDQYTLGNFLSEMAIFNGKRSFHIFSAIDAPYNYEGPLAPLAQVAAELAGESDAGTIIDLRPLFNYARRSKDIDPKLRHLIMSHDAYLFFKDGESGSIKRLQTPNFRWYPD